ncbi:MAG: biotin--[acetyl-CoA-carboxylase] ligase [Roseburia sp.]|nr:biotin--[acetyl-CoA-carboxylase] ligase [Roseburia sp.]
MSVKTELLSILEANRETDLSGEELAKKLGVSRTAVWKAVKALKQEGYQIDAANNRGYRLQEATDVLSGEGIRLGLSGDRKNFPIQVHKVLDSTNVEAKRCALEGEPHGLTVIAEEQTNGKGRLGRNFYSPPGTGIYMSILLRPELTGADAVLVTTAASVAVCRGIRKTLGLEPQIKWVNDVYLGDKKICGILTEAVSDFEVGKIDTVVVGIGINYRTDEFPDELKEKAGSVLPKKNVPRNVLIAEVLNEFWDIYENLTEREFMEDYRTYSNVIGKEVRFLEKDVWYEGKALDIDNDGGLIIECRDADGHPSTRTLHTGEITLRWK